jgi:hypothetical protein
MLTTPAPSSRCRRCGGAIDPAARRCPHCDGPGPRATRLRRSKRAMNVAVGAVLAAIGLAFALGFVAQYADSEDLGVAAMLLALPAFLLLLPVLVVAVGVNLAGRMAYGGEPIDTSWDVRLDGALHVVSLPATRISVPDHAWVDGERITLDWSPTGAATTQASLDGAAVSGTLIRSTDVAQTGVLVGIAAVLSVILRDLAIAGLGPVLRYALDVEGATVEPVPVADGERP